MTSSGAQSPEDLAGDILELEMGVQECIAAVSYPVNGVTAGLDKETITLLNWNIKKGSKENWSTDLERLAGDKDLVLIQEAMVGMGLLDLLQEKQFFSFSPGHITRKEISGVATFSDVEPLTRCRLESIEPWLGTPKATNITRFALAGSDQTLLVANTHLVNFSIGLRAYREQLGQLEQVLAAHDGPVIVSGDFNTWRAGRESAVMEMAHGLKMEPVSFAADHRVEFLGRPLDHIFVSGLEVKLAESFDVSSSDHNPLAIELRLAL